MPSDCKSARNGGSERPRRRPSAAAASGVASTSSRKTTAANRSGARSQAANVSLTNLDGGDTPIEHANKLALGPGTGLGVAGLAWSGERWVALPGEGGHMSLGAKDAEQLALLERIRKGRDHLSVERVLSGPGLAALYQAVAASHGLTPAALEPNDVLMRGSSGEDEVAAEALDLFVSCLGSFAGDMALMLGARGGVYLGGGIAPKIVAKLTSGAFRRAFEDKGRMAAYLASIPIYVITADFAALKGAAAALRNRRDG